MNMQTAEKVISPSLSPVVQGAAMHAATDAPDPDGTMTGIVQKLDTPALREQFVQQDSFLYLPEFLPGDATQQLVNIVQELMPKVNRNYLPGHKQGGSVSRFLLDEHAPWVAELYRSPALLGWLEKITGDRLQLSPETDPHAYALYYYTQKGDHIGWHYDTSYYDGRRYTMLLGIMDDSSCHLEYELHRRNPDAQNVAGSVQYPPGSFILFDGDALWHRVTPMLNDGETRVSLTFEYVTNPHMKPWKRFVSNMKDSLAYFGFRQVFSKHPHPGASGKSGNGAA